MKMPSDLKGGQLTFLSMEDVEKIHNSSLQILKEVGMKSSSKEIIDFFADYEMAESRLDDLRTLMALGEAHGVEVVIIEMPVSPTFFGYFEGGEAEHIRFVKDVAEIVNDAGKAFVSAPPEDLFPVKGRSDRVHLNKYGAPIFSEYLGVGLGELANEGVIDLIGRGGGD